jgi:hypothetical protein
MSWSRDRVGAIPFWRALAWIGSLGSGLTAFLFLLSRFHFEYHSFQGIVATPAFVLYPEQQDWWMYLLALTVVPAVTLISYVVWVALVELLRKIQGSAEERSVGLVTLTYLLWWVHPLTYAYAHHLGSIPVYVVVGLFAVGNGVFITYHWFRRRALVYPLDTPPPLSLQAAIALLGAVVGISLLTFPAETLWLGFPARTVLGSAIGFWGFWVAGSYLVSRTLHRGWRATAESLSVGLLPLSLLSIQGVLWWEVRQGGERVARYGSSTAVVVLAVSAVVGSVMVTLWTLRLLVSGKGASWGRVFWTWFFGLMVPLLLYALAYNPNIHRPLDLFHEGERVSPAQALMAGQIPYRDVVFIHGFLRDPGVALMAFRLFGTSIAGLRMLEQMLVPLALVATYYLAVVCLGSRWALLYSFLALTGFWPLFYDWRIVPSVAAILCLVLYMRQRRLVWAVGGGCCTFVALAVSFDMGVVALATGMAFSVMFSFAEWQEVKLKLFLGYFGPVLLGVAGVMLYLASVGALWSFLNWHWQTLVVYRDWNGMPFPVPPGGFRQAWDAFLSPLASIVAALTLSQALVRRNWGSRHWVIFLLLVANMALYNRGVVSGYVHGSALSAGSHLAPVLLLTLLGLRRPGKPFRRFEVLMAAAMSLALLTLTPVHLPTSRSLLDIVDGLAMKNRVEVSPSWVQPDIERVGPLLLPPEQASSLSEIVGFLEDAESFWDFTDHGALYFLSDHVSPTRFWATHHVITTENQHEVVTDLSRRPPRYVLFRSGTGWDAIAGVDRTLRSFLVSEYLLDNYHLVEQVGGFTVLEQGAPLSFPVPLTFRVDLGYVPFLWGRDRTRALEALHPVFVERWRFSSDGPEGWEPVWDVSLSDIREDGWYTLTSGPDPQLQNLALVLDPRSVTYLVLRMRAEGEAEIREGINAQVFWRSGDEGFAEERSVLFGVVPDGQDHTYLLRLASFPGWAWSGSITGLRLDPADASGVRVTIRSIEFIRVEI